MNSDLVIYLTQVLWIILVFLAIVFIRQRTTGPFEWASDDWDSTETGSLEWLVKFKWVYSILKYDKAQHFLGGTLLGFIFNDEEHLFFPQERATILNFLWEFKDGCVSWKIMGSIGGDGFSVKDFTATQLGIFIGSALRHYFFR